MTDYGPLTFSHITQIEFHANEDEHEAGHEFVACVRFDDEDYEVYTGPSVKALFAIVQEAYEGRE